VSGGRHAAGKHRRPASSGVSRQQKGSAPRLPSGRLSSGGAPFAVAGVAVVAVAAAGGLTVPEARSVAVSNVEAGVTPVTMGSIPLDRQINALRTDASAIAQRASRAQERISLEQRRKLAEQARKRLEALRPKFVLPVAGFRLTATFGASSSLWSNNHTGQDFAAPVGTPIRAVADGVIVAAGWGGAYGWRTIVRHSDGTETWYAHMSTQTRRSGKVKAGQMIGRVGSTGNATGPHLHLEVRINDEPISPLSWLRRQGLDI
jgi:murein DD-endopeptidase MepM/ murein hydrolase activator NlpD